MSHLYPLALDARAALTAPEPAARSKADAVRLCPLAGHHIKRLETEWLTLSAQESDSLETHADAGVSAGFVQRYENAHGDTVLAVTYWKMISNSAPEPAPTPAPEPAPKPDHTDDLYFRVGRTKKRRRRKKPDPNQLDLFVTPEEKGSP